VAEILGSDTDMELTRKRRDCHWLLKYIPENKCTCSSRNVVYVCLCVDMYVSVVKSVSAVTYSEINI
jgi:hypothetical protein